MLFIVRHQQFNKAWNWRPIKHKTISNSVHSYTHLRVYITVKEDKQTNKICQLTWDYRSDKQGSGDGLVVHDEKVAGSSPGRSGGRIFFSRVNFLCRLLFRYPLHPRVTAVARKRPLSFCQKRRWRRLQLNTHTPCVCGFACSDMVHGCMVYTDGSSFLWHQPCQRCKYTTSVDIFV